VSYLAPQSLSLSGIKFNATVRITIIGNFMLENMTAKHYAINSVFNAVVGGM